MTEKKSSLKEGKAFYHLPGLFEFYDFYKAFFPIYKEHREYFYDWCEIASLYGAPADCLWGGGRAGYGEHDPEEVLALAEKYGISARLTFSNSLLREEHLLDPKCNRLCRMLEKGKQENGIILHSELLLNYLKETYPKLYFLSSTTKVLTDFQELKKELDREEFRYVTADFRLNKRWKELNSLSDQEKKKVEFLCNECCDFACRDRKKCYEAVSRMNLGEEKLGHQCSSEKANEGYRFSRAMENPAFIGIEDIRKSYLPSGFYNFKIEGRSLGSALLLEFILYYMTKPVYHIHVREALYLENSLDLF